MRILLLSGFFLTNLTFMNCYIIYIAKFQRLCCLQTWISRFQVFKAINLILNNNIFSFYDRYRVDFEKHFERDLTLLRVRLIDEYFFCFAVNKRIVSEHEGCLKTDLGKMLTYKYVLQPGGIPVYGYMQKSYIREQIDLNESTSLTVNADQEDRISRKRSRDFFRKIFCCISLN